MHTQKHLPKTLLFPEDIFSFLYKYYNSFNSLNMFPPIPDTCLFSGAILHQHSSLQTKDHIRLICQLTGIGHYNHTLIHPVSTVFEYFRNVSGGIFVQTAGRLIRKL